jgi:hypothetical protein
MPDAALLASAFARLIAAPSVTNASPDGRYSHHEERMRLDSYTAKPASCSTTT